MLYWVYGPSLPGDTQSRKEQRMDNARRANFLPEVRRAKGVSQKELARRANMNMTSISRYENGDRGMSKPTIQRIAEALGVRPHELFVNPGESNAS